MRDADRVHLPPTYAGVLPMLFLALEEGTPQGRKLAHQELARMAAVADLFNAHAGKLASCLDRVLDDAMGGTDFGFPVEDEQHPWHESVTAARAAVAAFEAEVARVAKL